jgi:hypothetical protein
VPAGTEPVLRRSPRRQRLGRDCQLGNVRESRRRRRTGRAQATQRAGRAEPLSWRSWCPVRLVAHGTRPTPDSDARPDEVEHPRPPIRAGRCDHGGCPRRLADVLSAIPGIMNVEQDAVGLITPQVLKRLLSNCGSEVRRLVADDEDGRMINHRHSPSRGTQRPVVAARGHGHLARSRCKTSFSDASSSTHSFLQLRRTKLPARMLVILPPHAPPSIEARSLRTIVGGHQDLPTDGHEALPTGGHLPASPSLVAMAATAGTGA